MAHQRLPLPPGTHELENPVEASLLESVDLEHGLAKLVLTVGFPPTGAIVAHHQATKLAIHIGRDAAVQLMGELAKIAKTMGWPLPPSV